MSSASCSDASQSTGEQGLDSDPAHPQGISKLPLEFQEGVDAILCAGSSWGQPTLLRNEANARISAAQSGHTPVVQNPSDLPA